jgi:hypothetical protein
MAAHSASVMSDGYRRTRSGWTAALPYTCARQSHDGAAELNWTGSDTYNKDTRASPHCSVRFASPSYREALSPCAYNGKITPVGTCWNRTFHDRLRYGFPVGAC